MLPSGVITLGALCDGAQRITPYLHIFEQLVLDVPFDDPLSKFFGAELNRGR